jgi:simple sugar transport system permease protein
MFADNKTLGTLLASVGFGAANAFSITLKTLNMKPELVNMVPYLATIIGLVIISANKQRKENKRRENE